MLLCLSFFNQKENLILFKFRNQQEKKDPLKEVLASPSTIKGARGRGTKHVVAWCVGSAAHIHSESPPILEQAEGPVHCTVSGKSCTTTKQRDESWWEHTSS